MKLKATQLKWLIKNDLADLAVLILLWSFIPTIMITAPSQYKIIRVIGFFLCFPYVIFWPLALLLTPIVIVLILIQTIRDI